MANQTGKWAFIIGAVLAIIAGIGAGLGHDFAANAWLTAILVILGLVVGFVNISAKEVQGFLIASIAILATGAITGTANLASLIPGVPQIGLILAGVVAKSIILIAPAALIVALRAVYGFAAE